MEAYILLKIEAGKVREVLSEVTKLGPVLSARALSGPADVIVHVEASNHKDLADLVLNKLHVISGVRETDTRYVIEV